jgi:murein L,D-transpeptidase YafK
MLIAKIGRMPVPLFCTRTMIALTLALLQVIIVIPGSARAEKLYPAALMNWTLEGSFHALIVDKSQQRLFVWKIKDGEPSLVESYACATGENEGDKWARGDMKTPEGVYFFCSVIDGRTLPPKYGLWAFTTDYPNFVDRRRGKNGDGIWLHGRDKPLGPKPDSNGCVALENADLIRVSRFIRLQSTPLIVVDKMLMCPRPEILEREGEVRDFIESWRQAWESKNLDQYMKHYCLNFQSSWLDYCGWKEKKRKLNSRYKKIRVKLGNVYLYKQDGLITAIFTQTYSSDSFQSSGIKVIYLTHDKGHSIYAEDYHKPADDPFPVGTLLARMGVQPAPAPADAVDLKIRLVSMDDADRTSQGEIETPKPSVPSRGVVMQKIAGPAAKDLPSIPLDMNDRSAGDGKSARLLIVAAAVPEYSPDESIAARSSDPRTAKQNAPTQVAANQPQREPNAAPQAHGMSASLSWPDKSAVSGIAKSEKKIPDSPPGLDVKSGKPSDSKQNVLKFLDEWKSAWEKKDLDRFVKMYHPNFEQGKMKIHAFADAKKNFFRKYENIKVNVERVEIKRMKDHVLVKFIQSFKGDEYSDKGRKSMVLAELEGGGLRIRSETWSPL